MFINLSPLHTNNQHLTHNNSGQYSTVKLKTNSTVLTIRRLFVTDTVNYSTVTVTLLVAERQHCVMPGHFNFFAYIQNLVCSYFGML